MPVFYFNRLEYLDELIRPKATGSSKGLPKRFSVTKRKVYKDINITGLRR